jgi:hypothetical protein
MDEIRTLADDLFRERVTRARRIPIEKRLLMGAELFDDACRVALGGIRSQHPEFTDQECRRELSRRLEISRRLQEAGLYRPVEAAE